MQNELQQTIAIISPDGGAAHTPTHTQTLKTVTEKLSAQHGVLFLLHYNMNCNIFYCALFHRH